MSQISSDDVRKVAQLARLDLPGEKIATYTGQLESILEYVSQLQQVDTEGVPETTRAVEVTNVTRADGVEPSLQSKQRSLPDPAPAGPIHGPDDFRRRHPDGRMGSHPSLATAQHGEALLETAATALSEDLRTFLGES